jgi:hypothetical protein
MGLSQKASIVQLASLLVLRRLVLGNARLPVLVADLRSGKWPYSPRARDGRNHEGHRRPFTPLRAQPP